MMKPHEQDPEDREIMLRHLEEFRRKVETGEIVGLTMVATTRSRRVMDRGVGVYNPATLMVLTGLLHEKTMAMFEEGREYDEGEPELGVAGDPQDEEV